MRVLNRVVQWTREGIEHEADQRHADILVTELALGRERERARESPRRGFHPRRENREGTQVCWKWTKD